MISDWTIPFTINLLNRKKSCNWSRELPPANVSRWADMITFKHRISAVRWDLSGRALRSVCVCVSHRRLILRAETGLLWVLTRGSSERSHLYGASVCRANWTLAWEKKLPHKRPIQSFQPPTTILNNWSQDRWAVRGEHWNTHTHRIMQFCYSQRLLKTMMSRKHQHHFTSLTLSLRTLNFGLWLIFLLNRARTSSSDL